MKFNISIFILLLSGLYLSAQTSSLSGRITTYDDQPICQVGITLVDLNAGQIVDSTFTNENGQYVFNNLPTGVLYGVELAKETDLLEGVSIRDIVFLRLFVLGIRNWDNDIQYVAADVSEATLSVVSTFDLVLLRKALLGLEDSFARTNGWIFLNTQSFPIARDQEPNDIRTVLLDTNVPNFDFIGIKIGDLDNSADPCR